MLVNSALDVAPHDPEFQRAVAGVLSQVEAFFRRCIVAGQRDNTISSYHAAEDWARTLLGILLFVSRQELVPSASFSKG